MRKRTLGCYVGYHGSTGKWLSLFYDCQSVTIADWLFDWHSNNTDLCISASVLACWMIQPRRWFTLTGSSLSSESKKESPNSASSLLKVSVMTRLWVCNTHDGAMHCISQATDNVYSCSRPTWDSSCPAQTTTTKIRSSHSKTSRSELDSTKVLTLPWESGKRRMICNIYRYVMSLASNLLLDKPSLPYPIDDWCWKESRSS